jgi:O-antigen ligase
MDAWASTVLLTMAIALAWGLRDKPVRMTRIAGMAIAAAALPWLQYLFGQLQFIGIAWVGSAYMLGFALAVLVGCRWEEHAPGQLADGIFASVLIAALLSVGLQLHQWLGLDLIDVWLMGSGSGRPYANVGQPNQLATLLIWGILALWWFCLRNRIRTSCAAFATLFLSWGLTLTASRAAWVGVLLLLACVWWWSQLWPWARARSVALLLVACFVLQAMTAPVATELLLMPPFDGLTSIAGRSSGELRIEAWRLFLDAVAKAPWIGYGWNQGSMAHLTVAADHAPLNILFPYSHNLFLDLILWCGIPIGLVLSLALVAWAWRRMRAVCDGQSAMLFMMLLVVGNHALLELPLHHAYMLLPVGLIIGALDWRLRATAFTFNAARLQWPLTIVCTLVLAGIVRDYLRVEASHLALRFEQANFKLPVPPAAPEVLLLDQLRAPITLARLNPTPADALAYVDWMRRIAWIYPNAGTVHKLASSLAWVGQPDEAATWLRRMCAVSPPPDCSAVRAAWKSQAMADQAIAQVPWPE